MLDIGWTELAIVALIALLVIGPKELPATMRMIAGWIGKIRSLAREFQGGLDDMMRETELDKLKEQAEGVMHGDLDTMVENTIDPDG
ncbi:MAG: Sec-independent protein translocase protein TatB, partial [Alphaproteobacteria bacterium]|nr:Sec-independent protein translocase protein TatB [Alphaproteobacteria bacterium]